MHPRKLAELTAIAGNRIAAAAKEIGEKFGVAIPDLDPKFHDPAVARLRQMIAVADLLESVAGIDLPCDPDAADETEQPETAPEKPKRTTRKKKPETEPAPETESEK